MTLRVPATLARKLAARARAQGVKRSHVVREALAAFLDQPAAAPPVRTVRERIGPYVGSITLDHAASERDLLAKRLRAHNWRA